VPGDGRSDCDDPDCADDTAACPLEAAAVARAGRGGDPDSGDPDGGDADGDPVWIDPGAGGIHNTHTTRGHGAPGRCPDARLDAIESCEECGDGVDNDGAARGHARTARPVARCRA
jgi:hypothetical protein